jgi:hypothetical protein
MHAAIDANTSWSEYRIEVWQGTVDYQSGSAYASGGISKNVTAPTFVVPVEKDGTLPFANLITTNVQIPARRDGPSWWVLVTARGPDGHRYRLTDGTGLVVLFYGSVWDWLTAGG